MVCSSEAARFSALEPIFEVQTVTAPNGDTDMLFTPKSDRLFTVTLHVKANYPLTQPQISFQLTSAAHDSIYQEGYHYHASSFLPQTWTPLFTLPEILSQ